MAGLEVRLHHASDLWTGLCYHLFKRRIEGGTKNSDPDQSFVECHYMTFLSRKVSVQIASLLQGSLLFIGEIFSIFNQLDFDPRLGRLILDLKDLDSKTPHIGLYHI